MSATSAKDGPSTPKASVVLSEKLRAQILAGAYSTGERLPSERELCEQYELGRTSVREALRTLETQGLIATRKGRNGGSTVQLPSSDTIDQSIEMFIHGNQVNLNSVIETRELIEPFVAGLAALRRSDQDLVDLGRAHAVLEASISDPRAFLLANVDWHLTVARASHNDLITTFMAAISRAVHKATTPEEFNTDAVRKATIGAHARIIQAIVAKDVDAARRRMSRHVVAYAQKIGEQTTE